MRVLRMETCYHSHRRGAAHAAPPRKAHRKHMTQIPLLRREGNLNQEGSTLGKI